MSKCHWIAYGEQLPDKRQMDCYLVIITPVGRKVVEDLWWIDRFVIGDDVLITHWMERPKRPKPPKLDEETRNLVKDKAWLS